MAECLAGLYLGNIILCCYQYRTALRRMASCLLMESCLSLCRRHHTQQEPWLSVYTAFADAAKMTPIRSSSEVYDVTSPCEHVCLLYLCLGGKHAGLKAVLSLLKGFSESQPLLSMNIDEQQQSKWLLLCTPTPRTAVNR